MKQIKWGIDVVLLFLCCSILVSFITGCNNTPPIKNTFDAIAVAHAEIASIAEVVGEGYTTGTLTAKQTIRLKGHLQSAQSGLVVARQLLDSGNDTRAAQELQFAHNLIRLVLDEVKDGKTIVIGNDAHGH